MLKHLNEFQNFTNLAVAVSRAFPSHTDTNQQMLQLNLPLFFLIFILQNPKMLLYTNKKIHVFLVKNNQNYTDSELK